MIVFCTGFKFHVIFSSGFFAARTISRYRFILKKMWEIRKKCSVCWVSLFRSPKMLIFDKPFFPPLKVTGWIFGETFKSWGLVLCSPKMRGNSLSLAVPKSIFWPMVFWKRPLQPPRINMDTKPGGSENVSPFKHGLFSVSTLNFLGVYFSRDSLSTIPEDCYFIGWLDFQGSYVDVSENSATPKSSILIGFSIIFTIHFGGVSPYFLKVSHVFKNTTFRLNSFNLRKLLVLNTVVWSQKAGTFWSQKIRLMVQKPQTTTQDGWNPVNKGIFTIYHINWWVDPGFLKPSTVLHTPRFNPSPLKAMMVGTTIRLPIGIRWSLFRGANCWISRKPTFVRHGIGILHLSRGPRFKDFHEMIPGEFLSNLMGWNPPTGRKQSEIFGTWSEKNGKT